MTSSQTCSTCGTALHSDISRAFGQCGACRSGSERGEKYEPFSQRAQPKAPPAQPPNEQTQSPPA